MTIDEAIEVLKDFDSQVSAKADGAYQTTIGKMACDVAISAMQELQKYKQLGTLEEVRKAVERRQAKKPTYEGDGYAPDGSFVWDEWLCPHCGSRYEVEYDDYDYCPNCGQHIDWSEEE